MSDSNRGERTAALIASAFCAIALFGTVIVVYAVGVTLGVNSGRDQVTAREHYESTKQDNLRACTGRKGAAAIECVTEAIEAAQEQSDSRQDLYAQQDMSRWAFWMLIASVATFFVTAVGVWFVKKTLDATLKAVEDTGKGTDAMVKANEIAAAAQRAWIDITPVLEIKRYPDGTIDLKAKSKFENVGKTVATKVRHTSRFRTGKLEDIHKEMNAAFRALIEQGAGMTLMPGKHIGGGQTYGNKPRRGFKWDEFDRTSLCIISIVVYEIEGDPNKRRYTRALWRATRKDSDLHPGNFTLTWEDITTSDIVIGKFDSISAT